MEQGHAGAHLHGVERTEDLFGASSTRCRDKLGALPQPPAQERMGKVGAGLGQRDDRVVPRQLAPSEAGDLREHEPYPVAGLATAPQLVDHAVVAAPLRADEPL